MNWTEDLQRAIQYIENHILEDITADDAAGEVHISTFYFQKGFKIMTGFTVSEYIRNRRLYLAAFDVIADKEKIIDIAAKYGYDTPESFTKAFSRFHGLPPIQFKSHPYKIKTFLPLKIIITIQGGNVMDFTIEKMESFKIIGFARDFTGDNSYKEIPEFWNDTMNKYVCPLFAKSGPENEIEKAICENNIGEFGVCVDSDVKNNFRYFIAGIYKGGPVPEGMEICEIPAAEWVKFNCTGPMPQSIQSLNTKIFNEWLPNNSEYDIPFGINIEWYSREGNTTDIDYQSAIWVPVIKK